MEAQGQGGALCEWEHLTGAARDAVTDDMVARLAEAASAALELLDRVNRSGLAKAVPVLAQMAHNGDLERVAHFARAVGAAEEALTEEMVARLAEAAGAGLGLVDRLSRGGLDRLVAMLERLEAQGALERIAQALPRVLARLETVEALLASLEQAVQAAEKAPAAGGLRGLWRLLKEAQSQQALGLFLAWGRALKKRLQGGEGAGAASGR